ncbi:hyaluronidase-3 isoform X2 [Erpetoichthys calabaricus]|uniref:hyaluronidase-3 isoform X2 n=1 Tax=Erpetoichthys calabaricus TaxID=27687 RepID=UPI00223404D9|nr:hyaluronidase-3 isoform X2 [Erpetoichthys calabaricus]
MVCPSLLFALEQAWAGVLAKVLIGFCIFTQTPVLADKSPAEAPASPPIVHHNPFSVIWNMPTAKCQEQYGIDFDLSQFDIVENRRERFQGQNMTIFYRNKLGLYPFIRKGGRFVNGGVPQEAPLEKHLVLAEMQIEQLLASDFSGLAVIDWEEWRPLWVRNWGRMKKYQRRSEALVRRKYWVLPEKQVRAKAKEEFENGAMALMSRTLGLATQLRPSGLWGYYKFPDCYNYNWKKVDNYTGHCHPKDTERNNRLAWLWHKSKALYPSIYLTRPLGSSERGAMYVYYRVKEAMRIAAAFPSASGSLPVLAYARVTFAHTLQYLSRMDLEHTIGESASLGAAGVVLWGDLGFARSEHECRALRDYVHTLLGGYIVNVTTAARLCSGRLCHANGRCARRHDGSSARLHLSPRSFKIVDSGWTSPRAVGDLDQQDMAQLWSSFRCVCYRGWTGEQCERSAP